MAEKSKEQLTQDLAAAAVEIERLKTELAGKTAELSTANQQLTEQVTAKAALKTQLENTEGKLTQLEEKRQADLQEATVKFTELETRTNEQHLEAVAANEQLRDHLQKANQEINRLRPLVVGVDGITPGTALEWLLNSIKFEVPVISKPGDPKLKHSEDRRFFHLLSKGIFLHVEERNFRNQSGYDLNWMANAKSALDPCLAYQFGSLDPRTGSKTFDALPDFSQNNRIVVMVALVPGPELPPEDKAE